MLTNNHYFQIFVEGSEIDLSDEVSVRINNILYTPLELSNRQSEYSFSFTLPNSPRNNKIFGFASILEATNKFSRRFNSRLVADGNTIFEGTMILNGYSHKNKTYNANFVSVKVYSLQDIFGEDKMNKLKWNVDYQGFATINSINLDESTKYWFPLAAYGVFQKKPYNIDQYSEDYTSKFLWDKWNRWFHSAFTPSLNVMDLIRRYFNQYGYNVKGNAYSDKPLNNIYLTTNLGDEQVPTYNLGNAKFGEAHLTVNWTSGSDKHNVSEYSPADLSFKYYPCGFGGSSSASGSMTKPDYDYCNWSSVNIFDMLSEDGGATGIIEQQPTYMWDKGDCVLVAPADGFYEIEMSFTASLKQGEGGIKADTYAYDTMGKVYQGIPQTAVSLDARNVSPLEIHLMRNFDESAPKAELIFGKHKYIEWSNSQTPINYEEKITCFPHESFGEEFPCPVSNQQSLEGELGLYGGSSRSGGGGGGTFGGGRRNAPRRGHSGGGDGLRPDWYDSPEKNYGYVYDDSSRVMAFDPIVDEKFIMGFSSMADGCVAFLKNGRSWSGQYVAENDNIYEMQGYNLRTYSQQQITETPTAQNENQYVDSPTNYCTTTSNSAQGHGTCLVWLNRGDTLSLKAIQRRYTDTSYSSGQSVSQIYYFWDATVDFHIRAISPKSIDSFLADSPYYDMPTQFPYLLNLGEFLSNEMTIVSFIEQIQQAFNLEILQSGNEITINTRTQKPNIKNGYVDLNDRVGDGDAENEKLNLPTEYAVKWKIDEEEFGFVQSVPYEYQEEDNWKDFADVGYEVIQFDNDTYNITKKDNQLDLSYNWYHPFTWRYTTPSDEDPTNEHIYSVPVISKDEWFIDNYKYSDAMKEDGYSLAPRLWFRNLPEDQRLLWSASTPNESIRIALPTNHYEWTNPLNNRTERINISYKLSEPSLLQRYFDVQSVSTSSDETTVEVYLTQEEYLLIKNGSLVKINDDLYRGCEINGFDASGKNKTKLKLIKLP